MDKNTPRAWRGWAGLCWGSKCFSTFPQRRRPGEKAIEAPLGVCKCCGCCGDLCTSLVLPGSSKGAEFPSESEPANGSLIY